MEEQERQEKDVNNSDTSTENEVVNQVVNTEPETTQAQETQEQEQEAETSTQEVKTEVKDNRPIENVAWETKRKLDELYPVIHELKEYMTRGTQQTQQPTYSKAQLQAYATDPATTTEQRLWAYTEVDKLEKVERQKEYENLVKSTTEKTQVENRRNQSAQWVAQNFPDVTIKDNSGKFAGWNQNHPLLQKANEYLFNDKALQSHPDGFMAAVKMAAFDLGVSMSLTNKVNKTVGQLRKEQKKQLASAGGTRTSENPAAASKVRMEKLKEEYAKTGNREVFAEIIKLRKLNPFV